MIVTSAPGKIIITGEHAVVYDKLGVAAAINKRSYVRVKEGKNGISIKSEQLKTQKMMKKDELLELFEKLEMLREEKNYDAIKRIAKEDKLAASFYIIANVVEKHGFKPADILIDSEVMKNLGSSSSVFSSLALAISIFLGREEPSLEEISNLAYLGDVIAHGGTPSGIDNSVATYGGFLTYRKSEGIRRLKLDFSFPLLVVDSGEPANTAEAVSYVRSQRESRKELFESVMNELDEISKEFLDYLRRKDLEGMGNCMTRYYQELRKLGISTKNLDEIVRLALENGAYGAKPTGGWWGGCCIVLSEEERIESLMEMFDAKGFKSFIVSLGEEGVRREENSSVFRKF